ncbi:hypothetical protein [Mesorhizobium sp. M0578]|uniref:hypothetical protein n=1 Tax=unclassified Mesorhizobium TaxID=325217 RepID=UPI00333B1D23
MLARALRRASSGLIPYWAVDDIACVGWMLTAIEERVNERNVSTGRHLRKVINKILTELPLSRPAVH